MTDRDGVVTYLEPGEAARRLGVSPSGLRRLSKAYEEVYGPLNRRGGTGARLYPEEALEQLARARVMVEAGRCKSTLEALTALERGLEPETATDVSGHRPTAPETALGVLTGELRALRSELERLRGVIEDRNPAELPSGDEAPAPEHGPLVRAALWLELFLRRSG
jgi:DNA-binding transcriptional MerR regulator